LDGNALKLTKLPLICMLILHFLVGERAVGELDGAKGQPVVGADLENGSVVFDVVSMERTKCT
jgi:hypothetical protein